MLIEIIWSCNHIFHSKSINEWIDNLNVFKDTLADFNKTNIEEFFKSVYETQCHENLSALEVNILWKV